MKAYAGVSAIPVPDGIHKAFNPIAVSKRVQPAPYGDAWAAGTYKHGGENYLAGGGLDKREP